jgi:hypothetical protein
VRLDGVPPGQREAAAAVADERLDRDRRRQSARRGDAQPDITY